MTKKTIKIFTIFALLTAFFMSVNFVSASAQAERTKKYMAKVKKIIDEKETFMAVVIPAKNKYNKFVKDHKGLVWKTTQEQYNALKYFGNLVFYADEHISRGNSVMLDDLGTKAVLGTYDIKTTSPNLGIVLEDMDVHDPDSSYYNYKVLLTLPFNGPRSIISIIKKTFSRFCNKCYITSFFPRRKEILNC